MFDGYYSHTRWLFQFMKGVITSGLNAAIFVMSLLVLFYFSNKHTAPILIITAAIAGQTLYV